MLIRRSVFGAVLAVAVSTGVLSPRNAPVPFLAIPAWTQIQAVTRYPTSGTYDLSSRAYVGGMIGLDPAGDFSRGVVTFFWTMDPAGEHIVGVQGMNLSSLIVSLNQIRLMNQGPYLFLTYQPFVGSNPLAATLFGADLGGTLPEIPGDTILIDEHNNALPAHGVVTFYPADYFAGYMRVYLSAPVGVKATIYGADLTDQWWPLDDTGPGSMTTIAPMGTWAIVVSNPTGQATAYTLSVTPLVVN